MAENEKKPNPTVLDAAQRIVDLTEPPMDEAVDEAISEAEEAVVDPRIEALIARVDVEDEDEATSILDEIKLRIPRENQRGYLKFLTQVEKLQGLMTKAGDIDSDMLEELYVALLPVIRKPADPEDALELLRDASQDDLMAIMTILMRAVSTPKAKR